MASRQDIRLERLRESHFPAVQGLFKAVFHKHLSPDFLRQKYDSRYLDIPYLAHLAFEGDQAIAFAGALPMPFRRGDSHFAGLQFCDYMTLEHRRRRGIHTDLMNLGLEAARRQGLDFAFAMHSQASAAGDSRIGWQSISPMQVFVQGGQSGVLTKAWRRISGKNAQAGARFRELTRPWHLPGYVGQNSAPGHRLHVDYSAGFMQSRQQGGSFALQMPGFRAWLKAERHLIVGDLQVIDPGSFDGDWQALRLLASQAGLSGVVMQFQEASREAALFRGRQDWVPGHFPHWIPLKPGFDASDLWLNAGDFDTF